MKTFHETVDKIRWTGGKLEDYVVGYSDRFQERPQELPLPDFLASEIPAHRARYLRRGELVVWDRRR